MTDTANRVPLGRQLKRRKPIREQKGPHSGPELERSFGTFQLTMFGVGATVGTGIFFVLQEAVPDAGPAVVISFLVAGLGAGLSALCYAELASAIPVSGSTYSYAYHALGELMAMVIAACVLLEYGVSSSAVAVGWSGYFNELTDSLFGVSLPDSLSYSPIPYEDNVTGLINLPAVVLVLMCMMPADPRCQRVGEGQHGHGPDQASVSDDVRDHRASRRSTATTSPTSGAPAPRGSSAAAATIFFSFIGLDAVSTAGEEVRNPQKALPRAIMGALAVVVTIYVLVAIAGVGAQPVEKFEDPDQQTAGLSVILENITGNTVSGTILAAGAVISIFSVTLVTLYGQTRILFAMGRDGMLPESLLVGEPAHPDAAVQHRRGRDRGGPDRRLRPGRLPVGHGVDRHARCLHVVARRRRRAPAYSPRATAPVQGARLPGHTACSPSRSASTSCPGWPPSPG